MRIPDVYAALTIRPEHYVAIPAVVFRFIPSVFFSVVNPADDPFHFFQIQLSQLLRFHDFDLLSLSEPFGNAYKKRVYYIILQGESQSRIGAKPAQSQPKNTCFGVLEGVLLHASAVPSLRKEECGSENVPQSPAGENEEYVRPDG